MVSVRPSLKISVTTAQIEIHSSGNIPAGPVVVLGFFFGGWDTLNPPKYKKKSNFHFFADSGN